jgi:NTE family protein
VRLRFDTLDNAFFPTDGVLGDLKWTLSRPRLGADSRFDTVEGEIMRTFSHGRNTYQLGLAYATTLESDATVQDYFPLGGFLRLSGLQRGEISGPHAALAKLVYYRRIGETTGPLDTPIYFGFSAEAGNAWQDRADMDFDTMLFNGSLFAGFDTFIGPVYFGAGFAEGGGSNFYLFVGEPPR